MTKPPPPKVFIEPSAAGAGTPLSNATAKEGVVTNPGVRSLGKATTAPRCPVCGETTLKMRMNRRAGERVYCSNQSCNYDQSQQGNTERAQTNPQVKIVDSRGRGEKGVRTIKQSGPR